LAGFELFFAGYDEREAIRNDERACREGFSDGLEKEPGMGINRWSDIEERKRNETDAKAGDEIPKEKKGDASSRLEASEGPAEDEEKRRVLEKLKEQQQDS
jgi:hypothetical protein